MKGYRMGKAASARGILIQRIPKMAPNDMNIRDIRVNANRSSISAVGSMHSATQNTIHAPIHIPQIATVQLSFRRDILHASSPRASPDTIGSMLRNPQRVEFIFSSYDSVVILFTPHILHTHSPLHSSRRRSMCYAVA
jgi:hypothetical protein